MKFSLIPFPPHSEWGDASRFAWLRTIAVPSDCSPHKYHRSAGSACCFATEPNTGGSPNVCTVVPFHIPTVKRLIRAPKSGVVIFRKRVPHCLICCVPETMHRSVLKELIPLPPFRAPSMAGPPAAGPRCWTRHRASGGHRLPLLESDAVVGHGDGNDRHERSRCDNLIMLVAQYL